MPRVPRYQAKETARYSPTEYPFSIAEGVKFHVNPEALTRHKKTEAEVESGRQRLLGAKAEAESVKFQGRMALAQKLAQIKGIAGKINNVDAKVTETLDATEFNKAVIASARDLSDTATELKALTDPDSASAQWGKAAEAIYKERSKPLRDMGELADRFGLEFERMAIRGQGDLLKTVRVNAQDKFQASLIESTQHYGTEYINASSQIQKDDVLDNYRWLIGSAVKRGDLSATEGTKAILSFESQAAMGDMRQLIEADPREALKALQAGTYPSLGMANQVTLAQMARERIDKLELKEAYEGLMAESADDPAAAYKAMKTNPDIKRQTGLDDERFAKLVDLVRARANEQAKAKAAEQKQLRESAIDMYYGQMLQGNYSNAALIAMNADGLDNKQRYQMMQDVKTGVVTTDKVVWADTLARINAGQITDVEGLLKNGVKVDKLDEAKAHIKKVLEGPNPNNWFEVALQDYRRFAQVKDKEKRKELMADFELALHYEMEKKGLIKSDPEVIELARELMKDVHDYKWWQFGEKSEYAFERIVEESPWLTKEPATPVDVEEAIPEKTIGGRNPVLNEPLPPGPSFIGSSMNEYTEPLTNQDYFIPAFEGQPDIPPEFESLAMEYGPGYVFMAVAALNQEGREITPESIENIIRGSAGLVDFSINLNIPQEAITEIVTALEDAGKEVTGETIRWVWNASPRLRAKYGAE